MLSILILSILFYISNGRTYYVNPSNTNKNGGGKTWNAAFTTLEKAILYASATTDEIWLIGNETYRPINASHITDRDNCFKTNPNTKIYGGFLGDENDKSQRPNNFPSIISGDIGTPGYKYDNCYHVITYRKKLILDGVTIIDGYADYNDDTIEYNQQNNTLHRYGAALIAYDVEEKTDVSINNVIFKDNSAFNGGAIWLSWPFDPTKTCSITITNSRFENNEAIFGQFEGGYGGAIYNTFLADIVVTDTIFIDNYATNRGGAVYIDYGAKFECDNCIFASNNVSGYGGGLFAEDRNSQTDG